MRRSGADGATGTREPGTAPERAPRASLVTRFAVISLVLLAGLGAVVGVQLHRMIENRASDQAEQMGSLASRIVLGVVTSSASSSPTSLSSSSAGARIVETQLQQLQAMQSVTQAMQAITTALAQPSQDFLGATAWTPGGVQIFSTAEGAVAFTPEARLAATGRYSSSIVSGDDPSIASLGLGRPDVLEIYFPVRPGDTGPVLAVARMILRYSQIERATAKDTRTMVYLLTAGLTVLWLALFRLVSSASRQLRQQSAENRHLALHDTLTGLPNRTLLRDRAGQAIAGAGRSGLAVAILLLDLDRFKEINDTLGHGYGDGMLRVVAQRLREVLRDTDTAVRLGGDEFAIMAVGLAGADEALQVAERVQEAVHRPFVVSDVTLDVEASIGVAVAPEHGLDIDTLLRCADVAMYVAKSSRSGIELYDQLHDQHTPERLALLGDLRRALEQPDQLVLYYQPKLSVDGAEIVGVEALIRWIHPTRGLISPDNFIPVAEGTGLIHPLTEHTLAVALGQARRWMDAGHLVPIAVNISTRCLLDLGLPDKIEALLAEYGVPADLLRLEITESALMADPTRAMTVLTRLAGRGIRLSIDDFGTGFSSMSYLKRLPVDELKVDRSFVTEMTTQAADRVLVRSVVELGHNLGLHVVAEGVETAETLNALAGLGCDIAQGYHLGRPMPRQEIDAWLVAHDRAAHSPAPSDQTISSGSPGGAEGDEKVEGNGMRPGASRR